MKEQTYLTSVQDATQHAIVEAYRAQESLRRRKSGVINFAVVFTAAVVGVLASPLAPGTDPTSPLKGLIGGDEVAGVFLCSLSLLYLLLSALYAKHSFYDNVISRHLATIIPRILTKSTPLSHAESIVVASLPNAICPSSRLGMILSSITAGAVVAFPGYALYALSLINLVKTGVREISGGAFAFTAVTGILWFIVSVVSMKVGAMWHETLQEVSRALESLGERRAEGAALWVSVAAFVSLVASIMMFYFFDFPWRVTGIWRQALSSLGLVMLLFAVLTILYWLKGQIASIHKKSDRDMTSHDAID